MSYTLAAAARATGVNQTTILRAIEVGKLAGTQDERGEWHVDPDELHLLFPPAAERDRRYAEFDVEALGAQIESLLRQAGRRLRQQIDDARRTREHAPHLQSADEHERMS
jgi:hypothetical protein